jgi:hypothetical protein
MFMVGVPHVSDFGCGNCYQTNAMSYFNAAHRGYVMSVVDKSCLDVFSLAAILAAPDNHV